MKETIFELPNILKVWKHDTINVIVFEWTSFAIPLQAIQRAHHEAAVRAKRDRVRTLIAETSKVCGVLSREIVSWWGSEGVPNYVRAGITHFLTVPPSTALASLSTKDWHAASLGSVVLQNVDSLSDGVELARQIDAGEGIGDYLPKALRAVGSTGR